MTLSINSNIAALRARHDLAQVNARLADNFRRLSTGLRIVDASDDAGGLAMSERLRARIRSLDQAKRNTNDGISLLQAAEGALSESASILTRLRELAIESANGSTSNTDKETLDAEFQTLISELNRIGQGTEFNGIRVLDGSTSTVSFQIGIDTTANIDTVAISLDPALSTTLHLNTLDVGSGGDTSLAVSQIDSAIDTLSGLRGRLGAVQNRLDSAVNTLSTQAEQAAAAESRVRDVDVAFETAQLTRNSILQQASLAILDQARALPQAALGLLT